MKWVETTPDKIVAKWIAKGNPRRLLDLSSWILDNDELPDIPDEVEFLTVSNSTVKAITKLPRNLRRFSCSHTELRALPLPLPESLEYIDCRWCPELKPFDIPKHIKAKTHFQQLLDERDRATHDAAYFIQKWIAEGKPNKVLDLSSLGLNELPALPATVRKLDCSHNPLKSLHNLPPRLRTLKCCDTYVEYFENMPSELRYVQCSGTNLKSLDGLPDSVRYICSSFCCNLHNINKLPKELLRLNLSNSDIENIAYFPNKIKFIDIADCYIESIPTLPESLVLFRCIVAPYLKHIANLPSNLEVLSLFYTNLSALPKLPDTLKIVDIDVDNLNTYAKTNIADILKRTNERPVDIKKYLH